MVKHLELMELWQNSSERVVLFLLFPKKLFWALPKKMATTFDQFAR